MENLKTISYLTLHFFIIGILIFSTPVSFAESNSEGNSNVSSSGKGSSSGNSSSSNNSGGSDSAGNPSPSGGNDSGRDGSSTGGESSSSKGSGRVSLPKTSGNVHREGNTWHISFEKPGKPGGEGLSERNEGSSGSGSGIGQTGGGHSINPTKLKKRVIFLKDISLIQLNKLEMRLFKI